MAQYGEQSAGMEILTRGPVHEAFAETVVYDPTPGIIISAEPPALIEEVLPDQRPTGENVVWIPGYWAWDEDQGDFLWISGIWRNLPPNREWIPGYWAPVDGQFQWTSGYWEDADTTLVSYLPKPPRSVEVGPNIPASSDDQTWVPGSWQYQQDNYAWRAGYWVDARPDWCWTPSYYRWTRRGYVHVSGYWDYPVARRGVVFAPVRFQRAYISRPGFVYSPLAVISLSVFSNHLFLRPSYCHYYFGDYYEPRYRDRYYPSVSYVGGRRGYDPIFAYARWENRNDRNWVRDRRNYYEYRRDDVSARPPRTWAALNSRSMRDRQHGDYGVASRYDQVVRNGGEGRQRYQAVSSRERDRFVSQERNLRTFGRERQQREMSSAPSRTEGKGDRGVNRLQVGRSPVGGRSSGAAAKVAGAPPRLTNGKPSKGVAENRFPDSKTVMGSRSQVGSSSKAASKQTDDTGGRSTADRMRDFTRETRTKPGQRRDAAARPKSKELSSAQSKGLSKNQSQSGLTSKGQAASLPRGMSRETSKNRVADTKSQFIGKPRSQGQAVAKSQEQGVRSTGRVASPSSQGKPASAQKRNTGLVRRKDSSPSPQRKSAPTPQRNTYSAPQRKAVPTQQRKTYSAPQRKSAPAAQRKSVLAQRGASPAPKRQASQSPKPQAAPSSSRKQSNSKTEETRGDRAGRSKKNK